MAEPETFECQHTECEVRPEYTRMQSRTRHYKKKHSQRCIGKCDKCDMDEKMRTNKKRKLEMCSIQNQIGDEKNDNAVDYNGDEDVGSSIINPKRIVYCRHVVCNGTPDQRCITYNNRHRHEENQKFHQDCHPNCLACQRVATKKTYKRN